LFDHYCDRPLVHLGVIARNGRNRTYSFELSATSVKTIADRMEKFLALDGFVRRCFAQSELRLHNESGQMHWIYFPDRVPLDAVTSEGLKLPHLFTPIPDVEYFMARALASSKNTVERVNPFQ
jgi:hypothetical protein